MATGKEYVVLAFFKEKKIDYIYNSEEQIIAFSCFDCQQRIEMCSITTTFRCQCGLQGSLLTLIQLTRQNYIQHKIYNPKLERQSINRMLNKLLSNDLSNSNQQILRSTINKINDLIDYYEKNSSPKA